MLTVCLYKVAICCMMKEPFNVVICRSGVGSHYGTLSGPIGAFSAATKPREKPGKAGKNFLTNPGKIGTGYG